MYATLPNELIYMIGEYLDIISLGRLALTCSSLYQILFCQLEKSKPIPLLLVITFDFESKLFHAKLHYNVDTLTDIKYYKSSDLELQLECQGIYWYRHIEDYKLQFERYLRVCKYWLLPTYNKMDSTRYPHLLTTAIICYQPFVKVLYREPKIIIPIKILGNELCSTNKKEAGSGSLLINDKVCCSEIDISDLPIISRNI